MWLKRSTPQNIVIGGAAGAFPPMIGWASVTGDVSLAPVLMFLIIFLWTPPHFWALSLLKSDDYARAGVPMLPVVAGHDETRRQILIYTLILAPVGLTPSLFGFAGTLYGAVALACGAMMLMLAWRVYRDRKGQAAVSAARKLFAFSLLYVFLLFAALLADYELDPPRVAAMNAPYDENRIVLTEEQVRRRRGRSIAIALSLVLFVVLVYAVTVVKLGPAVLVRPL